MVSKRGTFASRFGVVAAVGGSVVGLGNIWRFPYVAGENGGAVFIIIYICISLLVSVPIMLSEFSIGRSTKRNSMRAFNKLAPGTKWKFVGYLGILTAFVILAFYCVIAGWALEFLREALFNNFAGKTAEQITENFNMFVSSGWKPAIWTTVFIIASVAVVYAGVEKGIERYNKIFMPLFVVLLVGLMLYTLSLDGAKEGASFLLKPDFSKLTGRTFLNALGQSFFSMSLGMGAMITYGSYIKKEENMFRVAGMVAATDVFVAVLSGLVIFPAVFSFGISPTSGPELVFITLPNVFAQMGAGYIVSVIFFMLLFLAAITSSVSLIEVVTVYIYEEMRLSRRRAACYVGLGTFIMGMLSIISQLPGSSIKIGGQNLVSFFDHLSSNIMLPIGGLFIVIFTGWVFAPAKFKAELTSNFKYGVKIYPIVYFLIKFVAPVVITLLFLNLIGVI